MTNAVFAGITANRIASIWMLIELTYDTALVSIGVKASAFLARLWSMRSYGPRGGHSFEVGPVNEPLLVAP